MYTYLLKLQIDDMILGGWRKYKDLTLKSQKVKKV